MATEEQTKNLEGARLIKELKRATKARDIDIAERVGIDRSGISHFLGKDMRFSSFSKVVEAMGYEVVLLPARGLGHRVEGGTGCTGCPYRLVGDALEELVNHKMHVAGDKDGNVQITWRNDESDKP